MNSNLLRILLLAIAVTLAPGCRTVDVASQQAGPTPKCPVHGAFMAPEFIPVSPGDVVYIPNYRKIAQARFPHHGDFILTGEREFRHPYTTRVRDFVCPDCTKAHHEFWHTPPARISEANRQ